MSTVIAAGGRAVGLALDDGEDAVERERAGVDDVRPLERDVDHE
jgi:hypothetical protein